MIRDYTSSAIVPGALRSENRQQATPPCATGTPLRIALISTPRSGNNWLRRLMALLYDVSEVAVHTPAELDWESLPACCLLGIHWHPTSSFLEQLEHYGFQTVVLARHPLDVLISVLHFALHYSDAESTQRWLGGEGGNERSIFAAMPRSTAFLHYATGERAAALLSVSHEWWQVPGCRRVRYEELVRAPEATLQRLTHEFGAALRRPIAETLQETTLQKLRAVTGAQSHFWQGKAGLWRDLLPEAEARRIALAHAAVFRDLGYECDPVPELDGARGDANWIKLLSTDLGEDLVKLRNGHLMVKQLRGTEQALADVRAQLTAGSQARSNAEAQLAESRGAVSALLGQLTSYQQQQLDSRLAQNALMEKHSASERSLNEMLRQNQALRQALETVSGELTAARQAASIAQAQLDSKEQAFNELAAQWSAARQALLDREMQWAESLKSGDDLLNQVTTSEQGRASACAELEQARERLAAVEGLGPRSLGLAHKVHSFARRHPRLASLFRRLFPGGAPP